jgi:hypothetical protein
MHTQGLKLEYVDVREVEGILVFTGAFTEARRLFKCEKTFFEF